MPCSLSVLTIYIRELCEVFCKVLFAFVVEFLHSGNQRLRLECGVCPGLVLICSQDIMRILSLAIGNVLYLTVWKCPWRSAITALWAFIKYFLCWFVCQQQLSKLFEEIATYLLHKFYKKKILGALFWIFFFPVNSALKEVCSCILWTTQFAWQRTIERS